MEIKNSRYDQYLDLLSDSTCQLKMHDDSGIIIERFSTAQSISSSYSPVSFMVDFTTRKYLHVDESCFNLLGFTSGYFLELGLDDYLQKWHSADYNVINTLVFADNMKFLKTLPAEKFVSMVFSYNYRARNVLGEYKTVLQRFSYIPSNIPGMPFGMIGVVFDINHFKNNENIIHTIEEAIRYEDGIIHKLVFKRVHPVYEIVPKLNLTKREIDVLHCIAEGLTSKAIAEKLGLSVNTINNHRKNMLIKTNCKSGGELMSHAIKHGLL